MANGYKVRLADGSEIGPMELDAVKDWYAQGLLKRDSPVMRPGASSWSSVAQVLNLKPLARKVTDRSEVWPALDAPAVLERAVWRNVVAGVALLVAAGAAAFFWWRPHLWHSALAATPWRELTLGLFASGLLLVRGWELGRRLVRVLAVGVWFGVVLLAGFLYLQGTRGSALIVLGSLVAFLLGLVALLSPYAQHWLRSAAAIVLLLASSYGVVRFGLVRESERQRQMREAALSDRTFTDDEQGLSLPLPASWRLLPKEKALVAAPPTAVAVLAHPRLGGDGFVASEPAPRGVVTLDDYLDRVLAQRRREAPSLQERERRDVWAGDVKGRLAWGTQVEDAGAFRDVTAVWKNGWSYVTLAARLPDDGRAETQTELEAIPRALLLDTRQAKRLASAVAAAVREVPMLSLAAAEIVVGRGPEREIEAHQLFGEAVRLSHAGAASLSTEEAAEISAVEAAIQTSLPYRDRSRLAAYLDSVRRGATPAPEEAGEATRWTGAALLRLTPANLARVQALFEKAIRAAVAHE